MGELRPSGKPFVSHKNDLSKRQMDTKEVPGEGNQSGNGPRGQDSNSEQEEKSTAVKRAGEHREGGSPGNLLSD